VDSVLIVVIDVLSQQSTKVLLIDHNHVIEELSPHRSNPSFCDPVLPRASVHGSRRLNSDCVYYLADSIREDRVIVCALRRRTVSAGKNPARQIVAPAGSPRSGPGGDKWAEALREKAL
jgi:hypothetical protein